MLYNRALRSEKVIKHKSTIFTFSIRHFKGTTSWHADTSHRNWL